MTKAEELRFEIKVTEELIRDLKEDLLRLEQELLDLDDAHKPPGIPWGLRVGWNMF